MNGRVVLVTGAGGSIGSALCRRLDELELKLLILYEQSEYALYKVDQDLTCNRLAVLGDVKDSRRLAQMPRPDVVFHCAAYKHVPLLEGINAGEGHRNNVEGTEAVMKAYRVAHRIVLLSTDKSVNPVSVLGQSKREAEAIAMEYGRTVARLGNILESSGSVVPKFREQIERGGPVTVTDERATRYFLPMDKAVEFLLCAAHKLPGIYTADMGDPVSILSLAKQMIGDKKIQIEFIGLRPGEKLHEELEEA